MSDTSRQTGLKDRMIKMQTTLVSSPGLEPAGASRGAPNRESRYSLLPASGSLIARKFSLFRRLGNSIGKRLNFLPKAEAPWLSQARNRRISLYFPVEQ